MNHHPLNSPKARQRQDSEHRSSLKLNEAPISTSSSTLESKKSTHLSAKSLEVLDPEFMDKLPAK
jgi:hypothetical protein